MKVYAKDDTEMLGPALQSWTAGPPCRNSGASWMAVSARRGVAHLRRNSLRVPPAHSERVVGNPEITAAGYQHTHKW